MKTSTSPVRLLTIPQAAQYLGSTTWAIRKLQWNRTVPFIRLGSRILFDICDLDRFIEHAKQGGKFGTVGVQ
jgi:excisionase family DNA binding protein